jgi:hypothetical protein
MIMATLRSLAMNALRLDGFWSITEDLTSLAHDIRGLLELLGWREPLPPRASGQLLMSPGSQGPGVSLKPSLKTWPGPPIGPLLASH